MKFLKLDLNDPELYNLDGDPGEVYYLYENLQSFKHMFNTQGDIFWLRHILTFREYFYILIKARFEFEEGQCLHWLINSMEKVFIRIHKLLFMNGFEGMKESLKLLKNTFKNLYAISYLIRSDRWQYISNNSSNKMIDKSLFGYSINQSKAAAIKIYITGGLYNHFCRSLSILLKRYKTAPDMPSNRKKQYWKPFPFWTKASKFEADAFEAYLAKVYENRLDEMLLTPNLFEVFKQRTEHNCCTLLLQDFSARILANEKFLRKNKYVACKEHMACFIRKIHSKNCLNPFAGCSPKSECTSTCDACVFETNSSKRKNSAEFLWKNHDISVQNSSKENCKEISILAEIERSIPIENYIPQSLDSSSDQDESDDEDDSECPFYKPLPPNFRNFVKQMEKKEKTKARLRDKLSKKAISNSKEYIHSLMDRDFAKDNYTFRTALFLKAQIHFKEEINDEILVRLLGAKIGKTNAPLIDLFACTYELSDLCPKKLFNYTTAPNQHSIGVGSDIPLDWEFLSVLKNIHISKRMETSFAIEKETVNKSTNIIIEAVCEVSKKSIENSKGKKKKKKKGKGEDSELNEGINIKNTVIKTTSLQCDVLHSKLNYGVDKFMENCDKLNTQMNELIERTTSQIASEEKADKPELKNIVINGSLELNNPMREEIGKLVKESFTHVFNSLAPTEENADNKNCGKKSKNNEEDIGKLVTDSFSQLMNTLVLPEDASTQTTDTNDKINLSKRRKAGDSKKLKKDYYNCEFIIRRGSQSPIQKNNESLTKKTKNTQQDVPPLKESTLSSFQNSNVTSVKEVVQTSENSSSSTDGKMAKNVSLDEIHKKLIDMCSKSIQQDNTPSVNELDQVQQNNITSLKESAQESVQLSNTSSVKETDQVPVQQSNELLMEDSDQKHIQQSNTLSIKESDQVPAQQSNELPMDSLEESDQKLIQQSNTPSIKESGQVQVQESSKFSVKESDQVQVQSGNISSVNKSTEMSVQQNSTSSFIKIEEIHTSLKKDLVHQNSTSSINEPGQKLIQQNDEFFIEKLPKTPIFENEKNELSANFLLNEWKLSKLRLCSHCNKEEPSRKIFKKCKLCKEHEFKIPSYYCSRECQTIDWINKHQTEHKNHIKL